MYFSNTLLCEVSVISSADIYTLFLMLCFYSSCVFLEACLNVSCPVQTNEFLSCCQSITLPIIFCVVSWISILLTYYSKFLNLL